jgi:hypothetical protein
MEKRPKVGLDMVDPTNPWHWLSIRGNVAEITEEGANAHIDKMGKKYLGQDKYGFHQLGDVRVICKILPERVMNPRINPGACSIPRGCCKPET